MTIAPGYVELLAASPADRLDLFTQTARRIGTIAAHVEKDFYLCMVLALLWNEDTSDGKRFLFKGGTSLSKAYGLTNRFSEDVDVTVWGADMGFAAEAEALSRMGNNKRRELLKEIKARCRAYVTGPLAERLAVACARLERQSGLPSGSLYVSRDTGDVDGQSLHVFYPFVAIDPTNYVQPRVLIESGAKSAVDPHMSVSLSPFVGDDLPHLDLVARDVTTIDPRRTFMDKLVILHGMNEWLVAKGEPMRNGARMTRHVYDVHKLVHAGFADGLTPDDPLLGSCVEHAKAFFNRPALNLAAADEGRFSIMPEPAMEAVMRDDYVRMIPMVFGQAPAFDEMIESLSRVHDLLNGPAPSP